MIRSSTPSSPSQPATALLMKASISNSDGYKGDYDGEAENYESLKWQRDERKVQLMDEYKEKMEQWGCERRREDEVKEYLRSLEFQEKGSNKNAKQARSRMHLSGHLRLYSPDYVLHCYVPGYHASKYVEFYHLSEEEGGDPEKMYGHIYLSGNRSSNFEPFDPPKYTGRNKHRLQIRRGKHAVTIEFLSNDHVKMRVPSEVVFSDKETPPRDVPNVFEFFGISRKFEKEREKGEKVMEAGLKRKRSPSER